jgi:hypothetical protein
MSMIHLLMLAVHLLTTIAKLLRPGGVRAVVAESLLCANLSFRKGQSKRRQCGGMDASRLSLPSRGRGSKPACTLSARYARSSLVRSKNSSEAPCPLMPEWPGYRVRWWPKYATHSLLLIGQIGSIADRPTSSQRLPKCGISARVTAAWGHQRQFLDAPAGRQVRLPLSAIDPVRGMSAPPIPSQYAPPRRETPAPVTL